MKKMMILAAAAAAVMAVTMTTGVFAQENNIIEADGIKFSIPEELADLVTVKTDDGNMLVSLYETASVEAAEALGENNEGAGWLFGISRMPEAEVKTLRCGGMDGMEVFAEEDDFYLVFNHPTDVRLVRESQDEYGEGMEQYGKLNDWAYENVRDEILANNAALEPEVFTNTAVDMYLAQAAYQPGTNFEVRSLEFAGQDLPVVDAEDHLEDLAENFVFQMADEEEAPDGEYIVLAFPDDEIRFDFFLAEGCENLVREVYTVEGEDNEILYIASAKEADEDDTPLSIMQDWCRDILEGDD